MNAWHAGTIVSVQHETPLHQRQDETR